VDWIAIYVLRRSLIKILVRDVTDLMSISRIFAPSTVRSFSAGSGERTDISTAMNVRITLARM